MYSLLPPGSMFAGRYRVGRCIASGGMGAVHEVEHVETGRRAALKVMLPHVLMGEGARAQFKAEARVAARLKSEHVVDVLDAGVDEGTDMPYLVMELLEGEDLGARLRRVGPLPPEEVLEYLAQVARALDRVHGSGIVHRDLKPENLFLTERDDGTPLVKVLDFGIAKILSDGATSAITVEARGTPIYMSPEQFTHEMKISPATDIYALGMVAFTLLSGGAYWAPELAQGMNVFLIARLAEAGPQQPASVRARSRCVELSPDFDKWFTKATASDPKGRFGSAIEALEALAAALGMDAPPGTDRGRPSLLGPESRPPRSERRTVDPHAGQLGANESARAGAPPSGPDSGRVSSPYTAPGAIVRRTLPRAERHARLPLEPVQRTRAVSGEPRPAAVDPGARVDSDVLLSSTRDSDSSLDSQGADGSEKRTGRAHGDGRHGLGRLPGAVRWIAPAVTVIGLLVLGRLWLRQGPTGSRMEPPGALSEQPFPVGSGPQALAPRPSILVAPATAGAPEPPVAASAAATVSASATAGAPSVAASGPAASTSAAASAKRPPPVALTGSPGGRAAPPAASVKKPRYTQD